VDYFFILPFDYYYFDLACDPIVCSFVVLKKRQMESPKVQIEFPSKPKSEHPHGYGVTDVSAGQGSEDYSSKWHQSHLNIGLRFPFIAK
jgi:hypothetical protein